MGMMFKGGVKPAHHGMQPGSHPGGVLSALVQLCHFLCIIQYDVACQCFDYISWRTGSGLPFANRRTTAVQGQVRKAGAQQVFRYLV